jgi:hypothetical protein
MKKTLLPLIFLAFFSGAFAQNTLVLEKIGTTRKYAFHLGDNLKIQTIKKNLVLKSYLWNLTDTSLTIGQHTIVPLSDVGAVYKNHHFPKLMSRFFFIAGAGYIILDSFNNLINNKQVFVPETLYIGGSLMVVGVALVPLWQTKHKIGIRWKLKIMDINLE